MYCMYKNMIKLMNNLKIIIRRNRFKNLMEIEILKKMVMDIS